MIEIGLMEQFHWTPMQIDQIPLGRLQRIFVAMEQRDHSKDDAAQLQASKRPKTTKKGR